MQVQQSGNTQAERLAEKLKALKPDVTANDRAEAAKELKCTLTTIGNYLRGSVYDNDTGAKILECLRKKVANREKVIS